MNNRRISVTSVVLVVPLLFGARYKHSEAAPKPTPRTHFNPQRNPYILAHFPHPDFKEPRPFIPGAALTGIASSDSRYVLEWRT